VHDVTLELWPGETLGLVVNPERQDLARETSARLSAPDEGSAIELSGDVCRGVPRNARAASSRALQIVFQNPGAALNRSQTVRRLIGRSLRLVGLSGRRGKFVCGRSRRRCG